MVQKKITVIVPVYNVERDIRDCLDSIVSQSYSNLEIILVDDGSQDKCGDICDEYALKDSRIIVVHKANGGLSSARNTGLDIATGEYISFIDSDDVVSHHFFEVLMSANVDVAQCAFTTMPNGVFEGDQVEFKKLNGKEINRCLVYDNTGTYIVVWNKLWKRDLFLHVRFPEGCIHEDEFITWRVLWNANLCAQTSSPLYYYRQREKSIMHRELSWRNIDALTALVERAVFFEEKGEMELAALTKANYCYRLSGMMSYIEKNMPQKRKEYQNKLKDTYFEIIREKQIKRRKKVLLTLRLINPNLYNKVKGYIYARAN